MPRKFLITLLISLMLLLVGFKVISGLPDPSTAAGMSHLSPENLAAAISFRNFNEQQAGLILPTLSFTSYLPIILQSDDGSSCGPASAPPPVILESFENSQATWQVSADTLGGGSVQQSNTQAAAGTYSARVATSSSTDRAQIQVNFTDAAGSHTWGERPGTYYWQWANVYLPSSTVTRLGTNDYITVAGLWPSNSNTAGWWLRVRQGGQLSVFGYDVNGSAKEFQVYGTFPQDQWVHLELGLHSQNGPGVKRAFAFLINGDFYGWYHQGRMAGETYDRAAMGILSTTSSASLQLFIDQWRTATSAQFPGGPDNRPTAKLQEQNYLNQSGIQWQIDWSTWGNDLRLDPQHGLYSNLDRLQSGRNLDCMPDLTSGWAEIEIDWPDGVPPAGYSLLVGAFAGLVGFHKEINREENLEVAAIVQDNSVKLGFGAWVGFPVPYGSLWPLPIATTINDGRNIPEPGDIIRVRWEQVGSKQLNVRVSYYDASTNTWYKDVINNTFDLSNVNGVNFLDGFHTASSITIDTRYYSIRRYKVGALDTYPQ